MTLFIVQNSFKDNFIYEKKKMSFYYKILVLTVKTILLLKSTLNVNKAPDKLIKNL